MVQETNDFKKNFNYFPPPGLVPPPSFRRNQRSPTSAPLICTKTPSPPPLTPNFSTHAGSQYTHAFKQQQQQQHLPLSKRQYSLDYDAKSQTQTNGARKNFLLNDFFPSFHSTDSANSSSVKTSESASQPSKTKTVGPIQRPLTNSTSASSYTPSTVNNNLLENFTSWLSNNFQTSNNNLAAQLNLPASVIENSEKMSLDGLSSSHFSDYKLFGTPHVESSGANFNETSIWNANNQAWDSMLINDMNSLAPTQQNLLNSSSSGNRIKSLWSTSFDFAETASSSSSSKKNNKEKKHERKSNK